MTDLKTALWCDEPSTRHSERAAWQPLYSAMELHEFEARIRAEEREKCAMVCEEYDRGMKVSNIGLFLANQIRKAGRL